MSLKFSFLTFLQPYQLDGYFSNENYVSNNWAGNCKLKRSFDGQFDGKGTCEKLGNRDII